MIDMSKYPIIEVRQCKLCGVDIPINCFQARKIYCSECLKKHQKTLQHQYKSDPENKKKIAAYNRARYKAKHKPRTYICKLCEQPFETLKGGVPKYCLKCLEELRWEYPFRTYYERRVLDE